MKTRFNDITKNIQLFDSINTLVMLIIMALILYPLIRIFSTSISDSLSVTRGEVIFFPKGFNLDFYKLILSDNTIPLAYWNSIKYAVIGSLVNVLLTVIVGYPLSNNKMIGNKFFILMVVITMIFPAGLIPMFILVINLGMMDSMWALILPNAIWAYQLLITKSFYQNIPKEMEESARIDGASVFKTLFRIIISLSKPVIAAISLFYFVGHWNSFFFPMIYLMSSEKFPLQLVLRNMIILSNLEGINMDTEMFKKAAPEGMKSAIIVISIIPMLIIYPFVQKFFVKGVMIGAVKG